jgi:hypothetical protein
MHPVLKSDIESLANRISVLSKEDAQIHPAPGRGRWNAQEIIEHLILTYAFTSYEVGKKLKRGKPSRDHRDLLKFVLRIQTIGLGYMPDGVPTINAFRPAEYTPESGRQLAERLLEAAESMDRLLVTARHSLGIQACGQHPFYGQMRVDEWRRYHAIHARHHLRQLNTAISYAQSAIAHDEIPLGHLAT